MVYTANISARSLEIPSVCNWGQDARASEDAGTKDKTNTIAGKILLGIGAATNVASIIGAVVLTSSCLLGLIPGIVLCLFGNSMVQSDEEDELRAQLEKANKKNQQATEVALKEALAKAAAPAAVPADAADPKKAAVPAANAALLKA